MLIWISQYLVLSRNTVKYINAAIQSCGYCRLSIILITRYLLLLVWQCISLSAVNQELRNCRQTQSIGPWSVLRCTVQCVQYILEWKQQCQPCYNNDKIVNALIASLISTKKCDKNKAISVCFGCCLRLRANNECAKWLTLLTLNWLAKIMLEIHLLSSRPTW